MGLKARSKPKTVLVLRTSNADGTSYGGFLWPKSGPVEAPDWDPAPKCGYGLHGALWGEGDGSMFRWDSSAIWQVLEVLESDIVDLEGKVKFPRCVVVYSGDRKTATDLIYSKRPGTIIGATIVAGDMGTATAGYGGTATAGYGGTATAGREGTATAGREGTATAGYGGTATAGREGTATAGGEGTATAGDMGTATAGREGTATAGDMGTATAGRGGTATAGDMGTATAGSGGTATAGSGGIATAGSGGIATAGSGGIIQISYYDRVGKYRVLVGYIGEDGLRPGVYYRVKDGRFVEAE